ncbi:WD40 repeat domain-containing protein [Actinomadura vinacea]|uniref:WD40 repeat domain-containing protein n=1 Tax=Actinomadura vinacea TaxID=115336 RepID=A0ABN3JP47_9ACTN
MIVGACVFCGPPAAADDGKDSFTVSDPRITESSGLATSRRHPGITYTHNDSGAVAQIFALGPDGSTKAVLTLGGAGARDWEAMAVGRDGQGRPAIYVADIGDNMGGAWPYVTVYRIPEPEQLRTRTLRATAFRFTYEDGPRNAEALMINPRTNRLYVVSKLFNGAAIYEAPAKLSTGSRNRLRRIADAPGLVTDAAFAPDGRTCTIRTYFGARVYDVDGNGRPGRSLTSVGLPSQEQGESVTYSADGRYLLSGSEGANQKVHRVRLPKSALPPSPSPAPDGNADKGRRDSTSESMGLFAALGVACVIGFLVVRRRS